RMTFKSLLWVVDLLSSSLRGRRLFRVKVESFWTCSAPDNASCDAYEFDPTKQEQQLCVKVIEKSSGNTLRARFGSKLLIAALAAKHPNITRYIQFLEDSHRMYIVMEFYTGPDLFDYIISNRPVSEEKAAFILEQISRATNFLHTQGGMHRDLKPENFMFQDDAQGAALKLVDFGSATSRNPYDPRTPMPMGSELEKRIMAEEEERKQLEGESTIGTTEFSHSAKRIGRKFWCGGYGVGYVVCGKYGHSASAKVDVGGWNNR
ncbi:hypothetical protein FOZ62_032487, partial [Perkinsus olseni]